MLVAMLVWINGAFGAGKTQTAFELHRRLPGSHVADPELLGYALHRMLPREGLVDFQDLPQWRSGVVETLRQAADAHPGAVIVPMTIACDDYLDEIVGGLRDRGVDVRHYTLTASPDVLRQRLRRRAAYVLSRRETWAMQQIDRCVAAHATARYATQVPTAERSVDEVVEAIAADARLTLVEPRLSPARYQVRRAAVAVRHIRL